MTIRTTRFKSELTICTTGALAMRVSAAHEAWNTMYN